MAESGEGPIRDGEKTGKKSAWEVFSDETEKAEEEAALEAKIDAEKKERKEECERLNKEIDKYYSAEIIRVGKEAGFDIENAMDTLEWEDPTELRKLLEALKYSRKKEEEAGTVAAVAEGESKESTDGEGDKEKDPTAAAVAAAAGAVAAGGTIADAIKKASDETAGEGDSEETKGDAAAATEEGAEASTEDKEKEKESEKDKKRGRGLVAFFSRHPKLKRGLEIAGGAVLGAAAMAALMGGLHSNEWPEGAQDAIRSGALTEAGDENGEGGYQYENQELGHYEVDYRGDFANEDGNNYNPEKGGPLDVTSPERFTNIESGDIDSFREAMKEAYSKQPEAAVAMFMELSDDLKGDVDFGDMSYDELCKLAESDGDVYDKIQERLGMAINSSSFRETQLDGNHKALFMRSATYPGEQVTYEKTEGVYDTIDTTGKTIIAMDVLDKDGSVIDTQYFLEECGNLIVDGVEGIKSIEESTPTPEPEPTPTPTPTPEPTPTPTPTPEPTPTPTPTPEPTPTPTPTPEPTPTPTPTPEPTPTPTPTPTPELEGKNEDAEAGHGNKEENDILGSGPVTTPTTPDSEFDKETGNFGGKKADDPVPIPDELLDENGNYQAPTELHEALDPTEIHHEDGTDAQDTLDNHEQDGGAGGEHTGGDVNTGTVGTIGVAGGEGGEGSGETGGEGSGETGGEGSGETIFGDDGTGVSAEDIQAAKAAEPEQKETQGAADEALAPSQKENKERTEDVEGRVDAAGDAAYSEVISSGGTEEEAEGAKKDAEDEARASIDVEENQGKDAKDFGDGFFDLVSEDDNPDVEPHIYGDGENGGDVGEGGVE